jgi:UDP-N-acetylglucosamine/UDP-N-acetylgalactosamine diphosphorylase
MISVLNKKDQQLIEKVCQAGQEHVFRWWDELDESGRTRLLSQLRKIDFELMHKLCDQLQQSPKKGQILLEPPEVIPVPRTKEEKEKTKEAFEVGENAIRSGKVCAFLVAGGQGTRLGFEGPKGSYPIGPVSGKSLFQLHAEKILTTGLKYGVTIPWYIMTSETNDTATKAFFQEHHFFGFNPNDIQFFTQRMMPALDEDGRIILDAKDHIFENPNGHGGSLLALVENGATLDMKSRGIEHISYFQVDNVLITIIDPLFIGYHIQAGAEMSNKMVRKEHASEKVGVFGRINGKLGVIEYSDMSESDMEARNPEGSLMFDAGSIAIHIIKRSFVETEVRDGFKLPYHIAHKKIPNLDENGNEVQPTKPNGYKFETFVFDALLDTTRSVVMEVNRSEEFSPVKNKSGDASPETAKRDLTNYFGTWLEAAGIHVPRDDGGHVIGTIEISPLFADTKEAFVKKVPRGLQFNKSLYIETPGTEELC